MGYFYTKQAKNRRDSLYFFSHAENLIDVVKTETKMSRVTRIFSLHRQLTNKVLIYWNLT